MPRRALEDTTYSILDSDEPPSGTRIRSVFCSSRQIALAIDNLQVALATTPPHEPLRGTLHWLRMVELGAVDLERAMRDLGAGFAERWLEACADWCWAVCTGLIGALERDGVERYVALELASEESSHSLLSRLEREGRLVAAALCLADQRASTAADELLERVDITDRMLLHLLEASRPKSRVPPANK